MAPRKKTEEAKLPLYGEDEKSVVYLFGDIDGNTMMDVVMPLMKSLRDKTPIELYISTPGGEPMPALAMADLIDRAESPVSMYLMGEVCSSGFLVALAGFENENVHTYAYPSTRLMWHGGSIGFGDTEIPMHLMHNYMDYHGQNWTKMCEYISTHSNMSESELEECFFTDKWIFPEEMVELGIVDEIL